MPKQNHSPLRTCLGCNQRDAQAAMVRIAIRQNRPTIDHERRLNGRGGYLHRDRDCLAKFLRGKVREIRSLRRRLTLDERREVANGIAELIQNAAGQRQFAEIR